MSWNVHINELEFYELTGQKDIKNDKNNGNSIIFSSNVPMLENLQVLQYWKCLSISCKYVIMESLFWHSHDCFIVLHLFVVIPIWEKSEILILSPRPNRAKFIGSKKELEWNSPSWFFWVNMLLASLLSAWEIIVCHTFYAMS